MHLIYSLWYVFVLCTNWFRGALIKYFFHLPPSPFNEVLRKNDFRCIIAFIIYLWLFKNKNPNPLA